MKKLLIFTISLLFSISVNAVNFVNSSCNDIEKKCMWNHDKFNIEIVYDCNSENHSSVFSFKIECNEPYIQAINKKNDSYLNVYVKDIYFQSNNVENTIYDKNIDNINILKEIRNNRNFPIIKVLEKNIKTDKFLSEVEVQLVNFNDANDYINNKKENYYNEVILKKLIIVGVFILVIIFILMLKHLFKGIKIHTEEL